MVCWVVARGHGRDKRYLSTDLWVSDQLDAKLYTNGTDAFCAKQAAQKFYYRQELYTESLFLEPDQYHKSQLFVSGNMRDDDLVTWLGLDEVVGGGA